RRRRSAGRRARRAPARGRGARDTRRSQAKRMNAPLPLQGLGVVITRPQAAAQTLASALADAGARTFVFPALVIEPLPPSPSLDAALAHLSDCDLAIFVSANAVAHGLPAALRGRTWPSRTRVAAIGEATARALRNSGFDAVISP